MTESHSMGLKKNEKKKKKAKNKKIPFIPLPIIIINAKTSLAESL